jgi:hypothetical protein
MRGEADLCYGDYMKREEMRKLSREMRQRMYVYRFVPSRISKTHTALRLCFNPVVHRATRVFETGKNTDIPQKDVALLIKALKCYRVKIDVSTAIGENIVKAQYDEAVQSEQRAKAELDAAEQRATAELDDAAAVVSQTCAIKHSLAMKWTTDLKNEVARIRGCGSVRRGDVQWPTQHARLSASSRHTLRTVLSAETLGRTFISLAALSKQVTVEVAEFIENASRESDRKLVIQQIKASLAAYNVHY